MGGPRDLLKSRLIKNTFVYTVTDGVSKAFSFLLLPLVSFYLPPEQLGIVTNFQVLQNILLLLAGQALVNSLPYFFYGKSREAVSVFISNLLLVTVTACVIFAGLILLLHGVLEETLRLTLGYQLLVMITVASQLTANTHLLILRLENMPGRFALLQAVQIAVNLISVVLFVIVLKWEARGKIYSMVVTAAVVGIVHVILLVRKGYIIMMFDKTVIKDILKFGVPLLPHSLSFWLRGGIDKILITKYCGLSANGLFSMALSVGAIYTTFSTAFNNAYGPYLLERISRFSMETIQAEKRRIVKQAYVIGAGYVMLGVLAVTAARLCVRFILDRRYGGSFQFIPWLFFGYVFNGFYSLFVHYIYNAKKTAALGVITFTCGMVQILLSYILIRIYGAVGAAYSSCFGSLAICVAVMLYSSRVYPMPWFEFKRTGAAL